MFYSEAMCAQALTGAGGAAPSMAAVASATAMSAVYAVVGGAMLLYLAGPAAAAGLGVAFTPPAVAAGACAATYGTAFTLLWHPHLPGISCTQAAFRGGSAQERGRGLRTGGGLATVALALLDEGWVIWGRLPRLGRPDMLCCCRMGAAMGAGMEAVMGPCCLFATDICCCGCATCTTTQAQLDVRDSTTHQKHGAPCQCIASFFSSKRPAGALLNRLACQ